MQALGACVATLQQLPVDAAHANLEVRVTYHEGQGLLLGQHLSVNQRPVELAAPARVPAQPVRSQLSAEPGRARFSFDAQLSHAETVRRRVTTTVHETGCVPPFGCNQTRTEERDQWVTDIIRDAVCEAQLEAELEASARYTLMVDYYGPGRCTLHIVRSPNP